MNRLPVWLTCVPVRLKRAARDQQGVALPLVLAVLVLGTLIVTPFLTLAGTSLQNSRTYLTLSREKLAAEAGLEQAVWDLQYGDLSSRLESAGGSLSYTLADSINGYQPALQITVSGVSGGGETSSGQITRPYLDRRQFDNDVNLPAIVNISGEIYAVVYHSSIAGLVLKTFRIDGTGRISAGALDTLNLDRSGDDPCAVKVADGILAVVYRDSNHKGHIVTVRVNSDGLVLDTPCPPTRFINNNLDEPFLLNISGEYFALVYRGPANKGYIQTLQIDAAGTVTNFVINNIIFSGTGYEPSIAKVSGTCYGIAYRGMADRGYLATLNIDDQGVIDQSVISNESFINTAFNPRIIRAGAGIVAIACRGASNSGYLSTLAVDAGGVVSLPVISSRVFQAAAAYRPVLINPGGTVMALMYRGPDEDGYLKTLEISTAGEINPVDIDTYVYESTSAFEAGLVASGGDIFTGVYRGGPGPRSSGFLITFQILSDSQAVYRIRSAAGETAISSDITLEGGVIRILNWEITR